MPSIARSADIERQLLAPLEALLRDAQALLGVELDADRLEETAGATSSESSGHPSSAPDWVQSAAQGLARPPVSRFSSTVVHDTVDSAQPEALALEPGAFPKRPFDRTEPGFSSPGADAAMLDEPRRIRFERAFHTASSTASSGSPRVDPTDHGVQDHGTQPAPPGLGIPLSPRHTAIYDPDEMAPPVHSPPVSRETTSATSAPLPSAGTGKHAAPASMRSATLSSISQPYFTGPARLAESLASSGEDDADAVPATAQTHRSDKQPESPTATMLSRDSQQPTDAAATPPAASLADSSQHVSPAPDSNRTLAIPLSPRQHPAPLAESLASSGEDDAAAVPATAQTHRSDKQPESPTAAMLSRDSRQPTDAAATPPAASLADSSQHVSPAPDPNRTLAIPLRPRRAPPSERSLNLLGVASSPVPGSHLQAAARRLASAVEPSLEQAYRLTQARLDPSAASASERTESPSLVRNTFNVTVSLHTDDASASLDSTALADALTEVLRSSARRHGLEI